jgi:hypothetical protein
VFVLLLFIFHYWNCLHMSTICQHSHQCSVWLVACLSKCVSACLSLACLSRDVSLFYLFESSALYCMHLSLLFFLFILADVLVRSP